MIYIIICFGLFIVLMKILEILLLIIPAVSAKLWRDRNGVAHPDIEGVRMVEYMIVLSVITTRLIFVFILHIESSPKLLSDVLIIYSKYYAVSITGFGLIFPYAFNYMWFNKWSSGIDCGIWKYVFNHLSEKAWPDRVFLKYNVHWLLRLLMYIVLFVASVIWFLT